MAARIVSDQSLRARAPGMGYIAGEPADAFSSESGIVTLDNVPGLAEVDLLRRSDRAWLRRQVSRSDGTYRFDNLPLGVEYDLISRDLAGNWDDVIAGRVQPYAPPQVTTASLAFTVGSPASTQMAAQYGGAPLVWAADVLPPGLSLSADGLWSGTPTTAGTTTVVVACTDAFSEVGARTYSVVVT